MLNYLQLLASMSLKHRLTCSGHHHIDLILAPIHKLLVRSGLPVSDMVRLITVKTTGQAKIGAVAFQLMTDFISSLYEACFPWYSQHQAQNVKKWLMSGITSDHHFIDNPLPSLSYTDSAKLLGRIAELLQTNVIDPLNRYAIDRNLSIGDDDVVSEILMIRQSSDFLGTYFDTNIRKKSENTKVKDARYTYFLDLSGLSRHLYNTAADSTARVSAVSLKYLNELCQKFVPTHEQKTGMFGIDATDHNLPYRTCFFEMCTLPTVDWCDLPQYCGNLQYYVPNQNIDALIELFNTVRSTVIDRASISGLGEQLTTDCLNFSLNRTRPFIYE